MESDRRSRKVSTAAANPAIDSNGIGIYLHIPFCEKKCFYCDFYSLENHSQRNEFVDSLITEIELFSRNQPHRHRADTIFLGGGTPSLLSAAEIESILKALRDHFDISSDVEFTMECNPGTVNYESLAGYRKLGVNRLSFGVQSFFDDELKFLCRIHNSRQAVDALKLSRACAFENVNLDLMYGLPGQSADKVRSNLERAVELNPDHISAYNLIVEPGTPLFASVAAGQIRRLDESKEAAMYDLTMSFLEQNGYNHYEISNYSRPGFECRHNLKYWNSEGYISFGPSAHSFLDGTRWWNVSSLSNYISEVSASRLPISAEEKLTENQLLDEFVMLQLRQGKIDLNMLAAKFKMGLEADFISDLENSGYARLSQNQIALTKKGFTVSDEIVNEVGRHLTRPIEVPLDSN